MTPEQLTKKRIVRGIEQHDAQLLEKEFTIPRPYKKLIESAKECKWDGCKNTVNGRHQLCSYHKIISIRMSHAMRGKKRENWQSGQRRECAECGKYFDLKNPSQITCSDKCAMDRKARLEKNRYLAKRGER